MSRFSGSLSLGLAVFVATLFAVSGTSAAAGVPLSVGPSYAREGASPYTGYTVDAHSGSGLNNLSVRPVFKISTGFTNESQRSETKDVGTYALSVFSGLQNVSVKCGKSCSTATYLVSISWNLTPHWSVYTTCAAGTGSVVYSLVNITAVGLLRDVSASPVLTVGSNSSLQRIAYLTGSGTGSGGVTHAFSLTFSAPLVKHQRYQLGAYLDVETYTDSYRGCDSIATATISTPTHPTLLTGISIS